MVHAVFDRYITLQLNSIETHTLTHSLDVFVEHSIYCCVVGRMPFSLLWPTMAKIFYVNNSRVREFQCGIFALVYIVRSVFT